MSISMSFEAKRNEPLTEQENARCAAIVDRYYTEYPFNKEYENFMVLTADLEPDVVYYNFSVGGGSGYRNVFCYCKLLAEMLNGGHIRAAGLPVFCIL